MAQLEQISGRCPHCGEMLEIPARLKEFSCMYCGARLTPEAFAEGSDPESQKKEGAAWAEYYKAHILDVIVNHPGIEQKMTKKEYPAAFSQYQEANAEIFRQMDGAIGAGTLELETAVSWFLDQLEARWDRDADWKRSRKTIMETDKFVVAIFLVPMVRQLNLPQGEAYCVELQAQWLKRYPKSPFYLGTYEELSGGFQKKYFGLCFITTAVCRHEGRTDDCPELTAFRRFRDGYLRACSDGPDLIDTYYDIAPGIVLRLELAEDKAERYDRLEREYLTPCYEAILQGDLAGCKRTYVRMVRSLQEELFQ